MQYGVVAGLVPRDRAGRLPGPSDESQWHRARRIYQVFTGCDIGYVHEPTASEPGRQGLRPPDEVLRLPSEGPASTSRSRSAGRAWTPGCTR